MPKLTREHQKIFGANAPLTGDYSNKQFGSTSAASPTSTNDVSVIQALATFEGGWQNAVQLNKLPVAGEMQALQYVQTRQLSYLFEHGNAPEWHPDTNYFQYSVVSKTGTYELYGSLINDNLNNALPAQVDDANWQYLGDLSLLVNAAVSELPTLGAPHEVLQVNDAGTALEYSLALPENIDTTVNVLGSIGGGTQDVDLSLGRSVTGTVDTSTTTFTFSNPKAATNEDGFILYLNNGGSQTVNWPASVDWELGTAPNLTTLGLDILVFTTNNGGTTWYGFVAGQDMQ